MGWWVDGWCENGMDGMRRDQTSDVRQGIGKGQISHFVMPLGIYGLDRRRIRDSKKIWLRRIHINTAHAI